MFVSLFIVSFFAVFQWSFLNFVKTSEVEWEKLDTSVALEEWLAGLKLSPQEYLKIGKNSFRSNDLSWGSYSFSIPVDEAREFLVTKSWWTTILPLNVKAGWSIYYEVIAFDSWASISLYDSWIANVGSPANMKIDVGSDFNIIWVRSLGWLSEISIAKWWTDFIPPKNSYSLYQDFSTWSRYLRSYEVKNYDEKTLLPNYKDYQVFLNSINYGK